MTGMPKSSGKKPGTKAPKKRSKSNKPQPTTVVDRIPPTTNYYPAPTPSEPHYNCQYSGGSRNLQRGVQKLWHAKRAGKLWGATPTFSHGTHFESDVTTV